MFRLNLLVINTQTITLFHNCYRYTVSEVVAMLEEDDSFSSANIYIDPPDNPNNSDEDSGDEDSGGNMDNLSGPQLRAGAELKMTVHGESVVIGDLESGNDMNNSMDDPAIAEDQTGNTSRDGLLPGDEKEHCGKVTAISCCRSLHAEKYLLQYNSSYCKICYYNGYC